jgi:hypothetical protein
MLKITYLKIIYYRPFSNCLVSALAKSRAASRVVRTTAGDAETCRLGLIQLVIQVVYMSFTAVLPKLLCFF